MLSAQVTPVNTNIKFQGYLDASSAAATSPFTVGTSFSGNCPTTPVNAWTSDANGNLYFCNQSTHNWQSFSILIAPTQAINSGTILCNVSGVVATPSACLPSQLSGPLNINRDSSITAWGDSLTFGTQDNTGQNYPWYLTKDTGRVVNNQGYPGQTSTQIAARFASSPQAYNGYTIIWVGRNDPGAGISQATSLANVAAMVAALPGTRYVVMSVINSQSEPAGSTAYNNIVALNAALKAAYPNNYLDIRAALVADYNSGNGADVANNASDMVPITLRSVDSSTGTLTAALVDTTSCPAISGAPASTGNIVYLPSTGEYIIITAFSGGTITSCTRGYGSTAATASNGASYSLIDYLHLGYNGYSFVASQLATYITAHDPLAGSASPALSNVGDSGQYGVRLGSGTLNSQTMAQYNTAIGFDSQLAATTGGYNTAVGAQSLYHNTTGNDNGAFGYYALGNNTTGALNNAFGFQSLYANTTGANNNAFGYWSLVLNTSGNYNDAFGSLVLQANTTGSQNDGFGFRALYANNSGQNNDAFGTQSLAANTSGSYNSGFGAQSLFSNTTGSQNSCMGYQCLLLNTTGANLNAQGYMALAGNTTGNYNNAFGSLTLQANTTGSTNNAFGFRALYSVVTGSGNTAFGDNAGYAVTGNSLTAFGASALQNSTAGGTNSAFGYQALLGNTTGVQNSGVGGLSGYGGTSANANVTGSNDTFLGYGSAPGSTTQQSYMTVLGSNALGQCSNCVVAGRIQDVFQIIVGIYSYLPACTAGINGTEGMIKPISDSTTNTWGATISGSGSNHVVAYCDGTNWTVMAK